MNVNILSNWLSNLLYGLANMWEWLTTPLGSQNENITGLFSEFTPLGIISVGGITLLIVLGVVKVILDAIPIV